MFFETKECIFISLETLIALIFCPQSVCLQGHKQSRTGAYIPAATSVQKHRILNSSQLRHLNTTKTFKHAYQLGPLLLSGSSARSFVRSTAWKKTRKTRMIQRL